MMQWTADDLSDRVLDLGLLEPRELDSVWSEFGTRDISIEAFQNRLLERELLTNFQMDKVLKGDREGFFYGKYRVLYIIGAGTFARVFRAVAKRSQKKVIALKVLRRRHRNEPEQVELFLREARMGERLRHPNIVRIHEVSNDIRAPFMVMDFVEGQTLRDFVRMRRKLDLETSLKLMIDIVSGLDYASKIGITHRDMKLSNVLVTSTGTAKLVDFGLATFSETNEKNIAQAPNARSIDYVALERGTNVKKNDPRSDLYFAGCMFYHMLSGVAPLLETRDRLMRMNISRFQDIKPIQKVESDLPIGVSAVINKAMTLAPDARYQEPMEMLSDLKRAKILLEKGEDALDEPTDKAAPSTEVLPKLLTDEGDGRTIMFVESKMEMQDLFRDQLKKRGYRVLITGDTVRAVERLEDDPSAVDCVVFSTQELGPKAVVAFNRLAENRNTASLPSILLIDKRRAGLVEAAKADGQHVLLSMPLKIRSLRAKMLQLLAAKSDGEEEEL